MMFSLNLNLTLKMFFPLAEDILEALTPNLVLYIKE